MMVEVLAQITDGRSAWAEFYAGVTATFESNESSIPMLGLGVVGLLVMILNIRFARWLAKRWGGSGRRSSGTGGSVRQ